MNWSDELVMARQNFLTDLASKRPKLTPDKIAECTQQVDFYVDNILNVIKSIYRTVEIDITTPVAPALLAKLSPQLKNTYRRHLQMVLKDDMGSFSPPIIIESFKQRFIKPLHQLNKLQELFTPQLGVDRTLAPSFPAPLPALSAASSASNSSMSNSSVEKMVQAAVNISPDQAPPVRPTHQQASPQQANPQPARLEVEYGIINRIPAHLEEEYGLRHHIPIPHQDSLPSERFSRFELETSFGTSPVTSYLKAKWLYKIYVKLMPAAEFKDYEAKHPGQPFPGFEGIEEELKGGPQSGIKSLLIEWQTNRAKKLNGVQRFGFNAVPVNASSPNQNLPASDLLYLEEHEPLRRNIPDRLPILLMQIESTFGPTKKKVLQIPHITLDNRRKYYFVCSLDYVPVYEIWGQENLTKAAELTFRSKAVTPGVNPVPMPYEEDEDDDWRYLAPTPPMMENKAVPQAAFVPQQPSMLQPPPLPALLVTFPMPELSSSDDLFDEAEELLAVAPVKNAVSSLSGFVAQDLLGINLGLKKPLRPLHISEDVSRMSEPLSARSLSSEEGFSDNEMQISRGGSTRVVVEEMNLPVGAMRSSLHKEKAAEIAVLPPKSPQQEEPLDNAPVVMISVSRGSP